MANRKNRRAASITTTVSDAAGRAIEQASHAILSFQERHPDPVAEAQKAVQAGLDTLTSEARSRKSAAVRRTKAVLRQAQGAATRARRTAKALVKRVKKGVQERVRQTQGAVVSGVSRPAARPAKAASVARPARAAASATRKPAKATGSRATRGLQAAHATRRTAHTASRNKRVQARRDRKS